jgi:LacI family transcriptional regulator
MIEKTTPARITIRDVAQLAGVSPATVSKVMNSAPHVSRKAQERVLAAIQKLNYRPNSVARSLKLKSTATIGLVTDDLEGVFTMSMMRGVEEAVSAQGVSVFLCNSYGEAARERGHLEVLLNKQVDGVILMSGYKVRERAAPALPLGDIPAVYLYQYTRDLPVPCVLPDDAGGAALGTHHLVAAGRRRVALINGPYRYEATLARLEGYRRVLEEAGLPFDPALVRAGEWHEESGYRAARELLALPERPDAVLCSSDHLAVGALAALREAGLRVPEDVALVGFDNRYFAAHQRPPLTTVALPLREMGQLAGDLLIGAIRGQAVEPVTHKVSCYLVERESSNSSPPGSSYRDVYKKRHSSG